MQNYSNFGLICDVQFSFNPATRQLNFQMSLFSRVVYCVSNIPQYIYFAVVSYWGYFGAFHCKQIEFHYSMMSFSVL